MKKNTKKNTTMTKKELVRHLKNLTTEYVENVRMSMTGYKYSHNTDNFDFIFNDLIWDYSNNVISKGLKKIK